MVAWEEQLIRGRVPEWTDKYVDYAALKRKLEATFPAMDKLDETPRPLYQRALSIAKRKSKSNGNVKNERRKTVGDQVDSEHERFNFSVSGEEEMAQCHLASGDFGLTMENLGMEGVMSPLLKPSMTEKAERAVSDAVEDFLDQIIRELHKAGRFYAEACNDLERKVEAYIECAEGSAAGAGGLGGGRRDAVEALRRSQKPNSATQDDNDFTRQASAGARGLGGGGATLQEELDALYIRCVRLTEFALLNSEASRKIAKKFDKRIRSDGVHQQMVKRQLMSSALADTPGSDALFTGERARKCRRLLERLLTVEHAAELRCLRARGLTRTSSQAGSAVKTQKAGAFRPIRASIALLLALLAGIGTHSFGDADAAFPPEAQRCVALLTFIVALWVGEACPFEGTAMLVPPLSVLLAVVEGETVEMRAKRAVGAVFSDTLYVALAGFVMTSVFASAGLDSIVAEALIMRLRDRPKVFLLSLMIFGVLLSALISNVTAPLLIIEALRPMLRDAPSDSRFSRATLLAVAFSCNAGGMATPISSPQNIAAMATLATAGGSVEWAQWFAVSLPTCVLTVLCGWMCILVLHAFDLSDDEKLRNNVFDARATSDTQRLHNLHKMDAQSLSRTQCFSLLAAALALIAFATPSFSKALGGTANASLLFIGVVVCAGAIPKTTFNGYSWHLLFLIGGGNALGLAVGDSGLLAAATAPIQSTLAESGAATLVVVLVCILAFATTFLSHTVAALVLMPLCVQLGEHAGGYADAVALVCALSCSSACGLPFSSFPNVSCVSCSDDAGAKYLSVMHFIKAGLPATALTALALCLVSWPLAAYVLPPRLEPI